MLNPADRPALKRKAKEVLRSHSPNIYLVGILFTLLSSLGMLAGEGSTIRAMLRAETVEEMMHLYESSSAVSTGAALTLATFVMSLFLNLVRFGWQLYTLQASRGEETGGVETVFACFQQLGRFLIVHLLMNIFIMLWSMLFIIPGIIAAYSYSQAIYIMLDDPNISPLDAISASKRLMRGHKMEYFVLELSFFGWGLLSGFTFGLLKIWLEPYAQVTMANYYNALIGWQPAQFRSDDFAPLETEDWWNQ